MKPKSAPVPNNKYLINDSSAMTTFNKYHKVDDLVNGMC